MYKYKKINTVAGMENPVKGEKNHLICSKHERCKSLLFPTLETSHFFQNKRELPIG